MFRIFFPPGKCWRGLLKSPKMQGIWANVWTEESLCGIHNVQNSDKATAGSFWSWNRLVQAMSRPLNHYPGPWTVRPTPSNGIKWPSCFQKSQEFKDLQDTVITVVKGTTTDPDTSKPTSCSAKFSNCWKHLQSSYGGWPWKKAKYFQKKYKKAHFDRLLARKTIEKSTFGLTLGYN